MTAHTAVIQNPELIEIDWEVHQLIELERNGFDEPPIEALRRLLRLSGAKPRVRVKAKSSSPDWRSDGVTLKEGARLRFAYRKNTKPIMGEVKAGKITAAGRSYDTLSAAANDLAVTQEGRKTRLNGWMFWSLEDPEGSGNWVILDQLRKKERGA